MTQVVATDTMWLGRGQCIEQHGAGEAYLPLLEALGRLGRGPNGAHLVQVLQQHAPSWLGHLPALVPPEAYEALERRAGGTTRERMLRELAEAVEVLPTARPLVLVIEDLRRVRWALAPPLRSRCPWWGHEGERTDAEECWVTGNQDALLSFLG